jgi:hypothetical protein
MWDEMDTTVSEAAAALNTSPHRVRRARARLGSGSPGRQSKRVTGEEFKELLGELGFAPTETGLSREALFVAAALAKRPFGLSSTRAVARAAGISPTTASRMLLELERRGIVERTNEKVIEGGVRDTKTWHVVRTSPSWQAIEDAVRSTVIPTSGAVEGDSKHDVPPYLRHLFWNVNANSLDTRRDGTFIAHRLLLARDAQGLAWLASGKVSKRQLRRAAEARDLDDRQRDFALSLAR